MAQMQSRSNTSSRPQTPKTTKPARNVARLNMYQVHYHTATAVVTITTAAVISHDVANVDAAAVKW